MSDIGFARAAVHQWLKDLLHDMRLDKRDAAKRLGRARSAGVAPPKSRWDFHPGSHLRSGGLQLPADDLAQKFLKAGTSVRVVNGHAEADDKSTAADRAEAIEQLLAAIDAARALNVTVRASIEV